MTTTPAFTTSELMVAAGSRELRDGQLVFAGLGIPQLAAHLALCARCQRRLLSAGAPAGTEPRRRQPPPPWRIAAVVVGCIVLVLMALMLLRTLATPPM